MIFFDKSGVWNSMMISIMDQSCNEAGKLSEWVRCDTWIEKAR